MANFTIDLGQTKFERGINQPTEIKAFLANHPQGGIAFCGRSNVGKSSLINALWGSKIAQTSKQPGRTQQINVFSFFLRSSTSGKNLGPYYLYDLPGYGFAEVSREMQQNWQVLMDTFFKFGGPNILLANIRDGRHPQESSDLLFEKMIVALKRPTFIIFNKMDKLHTQKEKATFKRERQTIESRLNVQGYFEVTAVDKSSTKNLAQHLTAFLAATI